MTGRPCRRCRSAGVQAHYYNGTMQLAGVFAPLPTPFDADDRLEVDLLKRAYERFAAGPLTGFVVLGSNGEAALLGCQRLDQLSPELLLGRRHSPR